MAFNYTESSNAGPIRVFRGEIDADGTPVFETVTQEERVKIYKVPPEGIYKLKVTGFTEPYIDSEFSTEDKPRRVTDIELEITDGKGKGARFFWRFQTWSLGGGDNPSNLLRIYRAGGRDETTGQKKFDYLLDCEFQAYVNNSQSLDAAGRPKYATLAKDTIKPLTSKAAAYDPFDETNAA